MNKIMQKLLEMTYPQVNITSLMEIIGNTPNPEVATELMCGLYVEPIIKYNLVKGSDGVYSFLSYNKWDGNVSYSYLHKETKGGYFPKGTKVEDVTMETFDSMKVPNGNSADYLYIPTGKEIKRKSTISLTHWNELPYVLTDAEIAQMEQDNLFS